MGWTSAQEKAIYTPTGSGNLLVSAAAGSGKTAVLVERILQKIINNETTIDRLLVVTFTEAAASEMREKIIKQLIKQIENEGTDEETKKILKSQIRLAETADIMTIDAFCMRTVQNNFHILGIEPDIGIADTATSEMLRAEAMEKLFDRLYKTEEKSESERFSRLLSAYSDNKSDSGLERMILYIHDFVISFADPVSWLDKAAENFSVPFGDTVYAAYLKDRTKRAAETCIRKLHEYVNSDKVPENLTAYSKELMDKASILYNSDSIDEMHGIYKTYFKSFSRKKQPDSIIQKMPEAAEREHEGLAKKLGFIRKMLAEQLSLGVTASEAEYNEEYTNGILAKEAEDLSWIVKEFMNEYSAVKEKRGVSEFADIEQFTYRLFKDNEDIREYYKSKYDEILIDEYQDTNRLQDTIFSMISKKNIFMVGDLKQSIYRFRGGDPYIFKKKSDTYGNDGNNKITLAQNFRSRQEVLVSVNDIFSCVMSSEAGDIEYIGDELIIRDEEREYYPSSEMNCKSELHYIANIKGVDKEMSEIQFVSDKIKKLLDCGVQVYDKDLGGMRSIKKKDIVILENSVKGNGEFIVSELSKRGIEAFTETESFFSRREISTMMSLLSVINNARQDIPLLAVMRSPIGGFSENELARIRLYFPKRDNFIAAVRSFAKKGGRIQLLGTYNFKDGNLRISPKHKRSRLAYKCGKFVSDLNRWRGYIRKKSVAQLIWTLFEETYFYDIMGAIEQSEESQSNLRLLYDRAKQFEKAGYKGLFNFIKYIENVENRNEDLGGAKLVGENHDVVRIMTIHKSKGLEFPVVFLMGAGKDFPPSASYSTVRLHKDLGYGLPYIHYDEHYMRDSESKDYIDKINKQELVSERMRLLYVALTRAREKLYVTVSRTVKENFSPDEEMRNYDEILTDGKMLPSTALEARGFYAWICPAAHFSKMSWSFNFHIQRTETEYEIAEKETEEKMAENISELRESVYDILNYSYPYEFGNTIPSRTSVTRLKEMAIENDINGGAVYEPNSRRAATEDMAELMFSPLHPKPAFMRDEGDKPANEIGTLYHNVMAELDLERIGEEGTDVIEKELERLEENGIIANGDTKYIDVKKIKSFYDSKIGQRILASDEVHREAPFQINIPATEYDPSLTGGYAEENVILQGIIDCFFIENGEYVLVDYKTDKVNKPEEIRKKYSKQLELYKAAIEKLTNIMVKECLLYLFDTNETI